MRVCSGPGCDSARVVLADFAAERSAAGHALPVVVGATAASLAWRLARAAGVEPADLPPEGYAVVVSDSSAGPLAVLAGADPAGAFYAARTLLAMARTAPCGAWSLPVVTVRDWPALPWRGVVEGFYGPPWTHADRLELLGFAGRHKLNSYVHAPKDDRYHRERWREPYPPAELDRVRELVRAARSQHVRFVSALAPGLSMTYSDPAEHTLLFAKAEQLWDAGVRHFALLFDDISSELQYVEDVAAFGPGPGAAGSAHALVCARFGAQFLHRRRAASSLTMCPTDYAGTARSPYRDSLRRELPEDILVWWTGSNVVVGEVTRQDVDAAAASYGHRLLLWDNFPVNDFDRTRLFLGPLTGRTTDLTGSPLAGIGANAMIEAAPSQLALATVAEYSWNPDAYDPQDAARRALALVAGEDAAKVRPLVAACSAWPPSAPQCPELTALTAAVLDGDLDGADTLLTAFRELGAAAEGLRGRSTRLVEQLGPWLEASAAMARAGELAVRLLLGWRSPAATEAAVRAAHDELSLALLEAEAHHADVLRSNVPPFVRAVLASVGGPRAH